MQTTPRPSLRSRLASGLGRLARRLDATDGFSPSDSAAAPIPSTGYEAASQARRLSPWRPTRAHINTLLATEGPTLRARSRSLVANSPYGSNASEVFAGYAAGTGIKPSSLITSERQKTAVEQAFNDWTDEADADGLTDFYGLQQIAARALFDAGEVFVRLRPRAIVDGLTVPFQLQLLESEQLDMAYTMAVGPTGNPIRQGVEFDAGGQRVAYWFFREHPGDSTIISGFNLERMRIPAANIIHIFKPLRPGQIRGRPWLTSGMVKMYDLDQYDDAELSRKKGAAMFMAFLTKGLNQDAAASGLLDGASDPDEAGLADLMMEPSVMNILPQGFDVKFSNPADVGPNYENFQVRNLYTLCASMGLPYHAVTGDVSRSNYSSLRAALLEVKRRIEQFQWQTLIYQFCRPVWNNFMDAAVLAGTVYLPGYPRNQRVLRRVKWITPKWDWVDPLKDMQAEKLAVDSGFKARSDVIESTGEDALATDERIAADHKREEELGLEFAVGFSKQPDAPAGADLNPEGADVPAGEPARQPPATGRAA
jgi:lambda family phage portal protein